MIAQKLPEKEGFVSEMKGMTKEALLEQLASLGVPAAIELQKDGVQQRELQQFTEGFRNAVKAAGRHGRTNEGRRTFQTLLTAAAHGGDGDMKLSLKRKSEIVGVHPDHLTSARRRVQSLEPDTLPTEAMENGAYWFNPRGKRSDATPRRSWDRSGIPMRFRALPVTRDNGTCTEEQVKRKMLPSTLAGNSPNRGGGEQCTSNSSRATPSATSRQSGKRKRAKSSKALVARCFCRRGASVRNVRRGSKKRNRPARYASSDEEEGGGMRVSGAAAGREKRQQGIKDSDDDDAESEREESDPESEGEGPDSESDLSDPEQEDESDGTQSGEGGMGGVGVGLGLGLGVGVGAGRVCRRRGGIRTRAGGREGLCQEGCRKPQPAHLFGVLFLAKVVGSNTTMAALPTSRSRGGSCSKTQSSGSSGDRCDGHWGGQKGGRQRSKHFVRRLEENLFRGEGDWYTD